jgi:hypothetical protein
MLAGILLTVMANKCPVPEPVPELVEGLVEGS